MTVWREKLVAFAIHFSVTLMVALTAAALIFFVWFPGSFQEMIGGFKLFMLVVGSDLALGALLSFVVYDSRKSRRALYFDYSIIALVQLGALSYGMYMTFEARPVFVVFVGDRFDVVTAKDIKAEDLREARLPEYRKLPLWGPKLVATLVKPEDHNDALFAGLGGKDISVRPKFFVPYESRLENIRAKMQPLDRLKRPDADAERMIAARAADDGRTGTATKWLPVQHKNGFWTALLDAQSARPVGYLPIDPY